MGGCGSREKDLKEKLGLPQTEFDRAVKKFLKLTTIKPGKSGEYITVEGFKHKFPENQQLAQKLFRFSRSQSESNTVDMHNFLITLDLFTRQSMKLSSAQLRLLDEAQLLALISFQNPELYQRDMIQLANIHKQVVAFSNAGKLFKELINMQSQKKEILCSEDDLAPILLINNIFENQSSLDFKQFMHRLKDELPLINKIIKHYFIGKFMNKTFKITIPELRMNFGLLNKQIIAMFNLAVPWFQKCKNVELLYRFDQNDNGKYNFNVLANCLLQARSPVMVLFRHIQKSRDDKEPPKEYVFGYFSASYWRLSPDISGDRQSFIFSITPKFKLYTTQHGEGQSKFALINPIVTKRTSSHLSPTVRDIHHPGLGLGGSGYEQHRIWIDGRQLSQSCIKDEDKTFQPGCILGPDIFMLNIDLIEVWQMQQSNVGQSTSYFRSTQVGTALHQGDGRQVNSNALREVMLSLNHDPSSYDKRQGTREFSLNVPVIQEIDEEDSKMQ